MRFIPISDIARERFRQEALWGEQNHPSFPDAKDNSLERYFSFLNPYALKRENQEAVEGDRLTWAHIFLEEVAEALEAEFLDDLRTELVQVAAVAVAWIESIDRNGH